MDEHDIQLNILPHRMCVVPGAVNLSLKFESIAL